MFMQVGNNLNEGVLAFLHHEWMEDSKQKIYYEKIISFLFMQYQLKQGLKEISTKEKLESTEDIYQLHRSNIFHIKSEKDLTKEQKQDAL